MRFRSHSGRTGTPLDILRKNISDAQEQDRGGKDSELVPNMEAW